MSSAWSTVSFHSYRDLRALPSFPTRRSSDLEALGRSLDPLEEEGGRADLLVGHVGDRAHLLVTAHLLGDPLELADRLDRSEEHTSELQSPYELVCRLLLEKKKARRQLRTGSR